MPLCISKTMIPNSKIFTFQSPCLTNHILGRTGGINLPAAIWCIDCSVTRLIDKQPIRTDTDSSSGSRIGSIGSHPPFQCHSTTIRSPASTGRRYLNPAFCLDCLDRNIMASDNRRAIYIIAVVGIYQKFSIDGCVIAGNNLPISSRRNRFCVYIIQGLYINPITIMCQVFPSVLRIFPGMDRANRCIRSQCTAIYQLRFHFIGRRIIASTYLSITSRGDIFRRNILTGIQYHNIQLVDIANITLNRDILPRPNLQRRWC